MATPLPVNAAAFTPWELAAVTGGDLTRVPDDKAVTAGLVTDSRAVRPGDVFVAVRGESVDGHDFLASAIERGAAALLVERGRVVPGVAVAVVEVSDVVTAFGLLARAHLRRWRARLGGEARVSAITGSAGKTTTKELCARLLSALGPSYATPGNLNNRVGVPAAALAVTDERFAVFELGTSVPGEIAALARVVEPDVAALLNVGVAHAGGFGGSRAAVAREKGAILEALGPDGVAVVNADDPAAAAQALRSRARCVRFGVSSGVDVRLVAREPLGASGSRVRIERASGSFELLLPVPGDAVAVDLVAAIAIVDAIAGIPVPPDTLASALRDWRAPAGRAALASLEGDVLVIDDSYNANPASMRAALATLGELRAARGGRAFAVLGEMRELGSITLREHEALGDEVARRRVDLTIGCGGAMDAAIERAERAGVAVWRAPGVEEAGERVAAEVRPGDVVLFKGSRSVGVERALAVLVQRRPRVPERRGGTT
jgi:UDP-N-acetylmuramoyl-tripeptide--D-alanyl-D-alanine ligase